MKKSINEERTYPLSQIKDIFVETSSTDITLLPGDEENLSIRFYGSVSATSENSIPLLITESMENKLYIEVKKQGLGTYRSNLKLDIFIPRTYAHAISVKKSSGDLKMKSFNLKEFNYKSSSGDLLMEDTTSEDTVIKSSSGRVEAFGFTGNINVETSSGNIFVGFKSFDHNVGLRASSGNVKLKLPETAQFHLQAKASSGKIETDIPVKLLGSSRRNYLEGKVGSSKNKILIKTSSGNIKISK